MKKALCLGILLTAAAFCFADGGSLKAGAVGINAAIPCPISFGPSELFRVFDTYSVGMMFHVSEVVILNPKFSMMMTSDRDDDGLVNKTGLFGIGLNAFFRVVNTKGFTLALGPSCEFKFALYDEATHETYLLDLAALLSAQYTIDGRFGFFLNVGPGFIFHYDNDGAGDTDSINTFILYTEIGLVFYF